MTATSKKETIVVGTRGSPLARVQTEAVIRMLSRHHPGLAFVAREIRTQGDMAAETPLNLLPRGLFAKELETAISDGDVDMAVHSFKDLPTELSDEFVIAAITEREDPRDVLVTPDKTKLGGLPAGTRLGTSSPRRQAQLKAHRPDITILPIRGNVGTRIRKVQALEVDGVVIAAAGIHRLGLTEHISEYLDVEVCLPAVGQGALAVEVRADDKRAREIAAAVEHDETRLMVSAEMGVLVRLGGGCRVPIAAYARRHGSDIHVEGMVASADGSMIIRTSVSGSAEVPEAVGRCLGDKFLELGAGPLLLEEAP